MNMKQSFFSLLALGALFLPATLSAEVDFEWRVSLNNRYHSDPYGYRYSLANRFRIPERDVIVILDSVRDPADAYLIFRLAELSDKSYDHVLTVYRQNRYSSWFEIASLLGIVVRSADFEELRRYHDLRDDYRNDSRRYDRYEDRRVIIKREEVYIPQKYHEQQRIYVEPNHKHQEYHDLRKERREEYRDDRRDDRREGRIILDDNSRRH